MGFVMFTRDKVDEDTCYIEVFVIYCVTLIYVIYCFDVSLIYCVTLRCLWYVVLHLTLWLLCLYIIVSTDRTFVRWHALFLKEKQEWWLYNGGQIWDLPIYSTGSDAVLGLIDVLSGWK